MTIVRGADRVPGGGSQ